MSASNTSQQRLAACAHIFTCALFKSMGEIVRAWGQACQGSPEHKAQVVSPLLSRLQCLRLTPQPRSPWFMCAPTCRLKMGVCEGSPRSILPDYLGRADYCGNSVNQAARFMDAGGGGVQGVSTSSASSSHCNEM